MTTIALAGNPNTGKTTVFNQLVGAREKIGNWPGTTVERKEGAFVYRDCQAVVVDLPGVYSLNAYSPDEKIARNFLIKEQPQLVIVVVDAANLQRHLYLVIQLLEMGQNTIICLNKMDLAQELGLDIATRKLAEILNAPVVETIALRAQGLERLKQTVAENVLRPQPPLRIHYSELEELICHLEQMLEGNGVQLGVNARSIALRILQEDQDIFEKLKGQTIFPELMQWLESVKKKHPVDMETRIVEKKYAFIKGVVIECAQKHLTLPERVTISDQIDRLVTHRLLGLPIFLGFMYFLFSLVFKVGEPLVRLVHLLFFRLGQQVANGVQAFNLPDWIGSLIAEGVIAGVGSVLSFLPYIMLLFLGISFLQDTGYLARAAFMMDRIMHALGLHGKSFIPMLLGFGCNIPGIMAARTLGSYKDRILTILVLPLMSCAARLPVYTLFAAALFPRHQHLVVFSLYVLGIVLAVIMARIFRRVFFQAESTPLIIELPPYRWPRWRDIIYQMWFQAKMFVIKAGTIIFLFVILSWALAYLPLGVEYASKESLIGRMGSWITPVFSPAGFGFWQASVALLFGIMAKEMVVGILGTLYGVDPSGLATVLQHSFTPLSGFAFLIMTAIYIPCIPTIVVIKKETNFKWAALAVVYTLGLGWTVSVLFYQIGRLIVG